jgi:hypothetical protein
MTRREAILASIDLSDCDEWVANSEWGEGVARIGRHLLGWNGHGIYSMVSYPTAEVASEMFAQQASDPFYTDDEVEA